MTYSFQTSTGDAKFASPAQQLIALAIAFCAPTKNQTKIIKRVNIMTKTKLLFLTFAILMSLVFIYHLLDEMESEKKNSDPPKHLDAQDTSDVRQVTEELSQTQAEPTQKTDDGEVKHAHPTERAEHKGSFPSETTGAPHHLNGGSIDRENIDGLGRAEPEIKEQFHNTDTLNNSGISVTTSRVETPNQEPSTIRMNNRKTQEKTIEKEYTPPSEKMTKDQVKELIILSMIIIFILLVAMVLERVSNNRSR